MTTSTTPAPAPPSALLNQSQSLTGQHRRILFFAWGGWFTGFASLMLLSFLLEPVKRAFGPTEAQLAWLTGVGIGMSGVGGFVFGWLADSLGRRTSIAVAIVTFVAGNLLCALASNFEFFFAARALTGLGIGGSWGAGQALVGETFPPHLRGRYSAYAQSGAPCGLGCAAILGSFAEPVLGWRGVFALGILPLLLLALVRVVPESDVWKRHGRRGLATIAGGFLEPGTASMFARCFLLTAFNMSNYYFMITWLPRYLQVERGLSIARSGWATLAFVAGALLGYPAFGYAADRMGRRWAFTAFSALTALGLLMFTVLWSALGSPSLILLFLFVAGVGTGTWSLFGPMMSEVFPTHVRGSAMSIIMNSTRGVQFVAPWVIVTVTPIWGMSGGIALAAGFALLAAGWVWTLPETRGRRIEA